MIGDAKADLRKAQEMKQIYEEAKDNFIEAPDLSSYFEQKSQGKSAYDKF